MHATQLALERNRQETEALAARNAEAVAARFQAIEQALTAKRSGELEALEQRMQSTHRLLLIVAGAIAIGGVSGVAVDGLSAMARGKPAGRVFRDGASREPGRAAAGGAGRANCSAAERRPNPTPASSAP